MSTRTHPEELAKEAQDALDKAGSKAGAARLLGIPITTLKDRLQIAARLGIGTKHPTKPGFVIDRESTLYNAETGAPILEWVKTKHDPSLEDVTEALKTAFAEYNGRGLLPVVRPPSKISKDLLTVYPLSDHHLGLFAWGLEVGADYDLKIAAGLLRSCMSDLVAQSPPSETGLVLGLGDFFHSQKDDNRTPRSGAQLDVDTRYSKVLQVGVLLAIDCIRMALEKHNKVIVRMLPGNHDMDAARALTLGLWAFYHGHPRVTVDTDPSYFFHMRFGEVMLGSTHGDMVHPVDIPGVMASYWPEEWGATKYRYAYLGHVHHKSIGGGEKAGVVWETFRSLTAKDAWHFQSGYSSGRSMTSITHHRNKGEIMRHTVVPDLPKEKSNG
jgi:hypothetical protein